MAKPKRECLIVGNWKMYKTIDEALSFIEKTIPLAAKAKSGVWLAVPYTAISACAEKAKTSPILIGAQNMNDASSGAFTGEIAAPMLVEAGAKFVILGHSERRKIFSESNDFIQKKVKRALECKLRPILCIGETNEQRESGKTESVLHEQITECLKDIEPTDELVIAYEPVWAIGTGKPATGDIAQNTHSYIRGVLQELWGKTVGNKTCIIYGGSVNDENCKSFLDENDIDGLLIGSASLMPETFTKIITLSDNITT